MKQWLLLPHGSQLSNKVLQQQDAVYNIDPILVLINGNPFNLFFCFILTKDESVVFANDMPVAIYKPLSLRILVQFCFIRFFEVRHICTGRPLRSCLHYHKPIRLVDGIIDCVFAVAPRTAHGVLHIVVAQILQFFLFTGSDVAVNNSPKDIICKGFCH